MSKQLRKKLCITYGDELIDFEIFESTHRAHKILIKVYSDCRVVVSAPPSTDEEAIIDAVKQRSRWIYKKLIEFRVQHEFITPRQYKSGESHYYLGKQYQLKVIEDQTQRKAVKLLRGELQVTITKYSSEGVKSLLNDWYRLRANLIFKERLKLLLDRTLWIDHIPQIRLLMMHTQWGSCSPSGGIILNPILVKAPSSCIDYVILHELCHLAEHNHSDRFYQLLGQVMPDWQVRKKKLDQMAEKLFS